MEQYDIVRFYQNPDKKTRVILRCLTEKEKDEYLKNPKTSTQGKKPFGQNWFDGYTVKGKY